MSKVLFSVIILAGLFSVSTAQTTATNFTTDDCAGTSFDLFTELDNGKVVIIAWVMPCGACIAPSLTAYNIAVSYETLNPGRILYFLVDDYADTDCTVLTNWGLTNGIGPELNVFSSPEISMSDYGTAGMPKIVVLGGTEHEVFFNKNGAAAGDVDDLEQAVIDALAADVTGIMQNNNNSGIEVFTSISAEGIKINYDLPNSGFTSYQVINVEGKIVEKNSFVFESAGKHENTINIGNVSAGVYFLRFVFGQEVKVIKFNM